MKLLLALLLAGIFSNSHDVTTLPAWGPYSKQYAGISHIPDVQGGVRVDFSLASGLYRRSATCIPNRLFESGCYPWEVSPDLRHITYREEIEWKDRVYVDATWHTVDDGTVLLEMHCVNNSPVPQNLKLLTTASVHFAEEYPSVKAKGADYCIHAINYEDYEPAVRGHDYGLVYDGKMRGERRDRESLCGSVIAFSGKAGDCLRMKLPEYEGTVRMRCKARRGSRVDLEINGTPFAVKGSGKYELVAIPYEGPELTVSAAGDGAIMIDSFIFGSGASVVPAPPGYEPETVVTDGGCLLKYGACPDWYGIGWNFPITDLVNYDSSELDMLMRTKANNHVSKHFRGDGKGFFSCVAQRPVMLGPGRDTTVWNLIVKGSRARVESSIAAFRSDEASFTSKAGKYRFSDGRLLEAASKYVLGEQLIQATLLTNVVYPVYTQKQYIRHFTPGLNWNSLYTWDSGTISMALGDIDPTLAFETIRAYTTEPGAQSAFIHHGTPLPIQFFAFEDMCSKTCDMQKMEFLYPRLKQYYEFMVGKDPTSTTRMPSGLLRTWDYFYNSGGWDDYPPQWYLKEHPQLYPSVAPVISTSCYIRAAKILRIVAAHLGLKKDVKAYDKDIKALSAAILDNAWDADCGYFGYVTHDADGKPAGLFKAPDGSNFNKGLDGVSPLLAGIGSEEQKARMLENLFSEKHMWTPYGLSTVDRSASYYKVDGYWNGCIWMPHQLFQWKAMLDLGLAERAHQIAFTALDTWAAETSESYQCYEHFFVDSGRGGGWHNFSGLSSPMVNWFTACFRKGTLSTGFDTLVTAQEWAADYSSLKAELLFDKDASGHRTSVSVCMAPAGGYEATVGGKPAEVWSPYEGLVYVSVPATARGTVLEVRTK